MIKVSGTSSSGLIANGSFTVPTNQSVARSHPSLESRYQSSQTREKLFSNISITAECIAQSKTATYCCAAAKVKSLPYAASLSEHGSRRHSGLIVTISISAKKTRYRRAHRRGRGFSYSVLKTSVVMAIPSDCKENRREKDVHSP